MSKKAVLTAEKREAAGSRANRRIRREGLIPGIIYGLGEESMPIIIRKDIFRKAVLEHGLTSVYEVLIEGEEPTNIMIKAIQSDPLTREPDHVDLQRISMTEEVRVEVPIHFHNKEFLEMKKLILQTQMDFILVRGLPGLIPSSFDIDCEKILENDDRVFVSNLEMPEGVETDVDLDQLVASVTEAKEIVEEVVEDEEAAEGEEAAEAAEEDAGEEAEE